VLRSSIPLYDSLAATYEAHFALPHRRAYDDLAWELCAAALPPQPAVVIDLGCGIGRWAQRLLVAGYTVVGIEPSPAMAERSLARLSTWHGSAFSLLRGRADEVDVGAASADAVLAIGSLQYTENPAATLRRAARWLRPGGVVCVLVDSLQALVLELLRADHQFEAIERLRTRLGTWRVNGLEADLHLFDLAALRSAVVDAGLDVTRASGLLVGFSAHGREEMSRRLAEDYPDALAAERTLSQVPELADLGKQLLVIGHRPSRPGP
jgi:ubiquinone/menaquinone biosynthesis C-methylase UbiE